MYARKSSLMLARNTKSNKVERALYLTTLLESSRVRRAEIDRGVATQSILVGFFPQLLLVYGGHVLIEF